MRLKQLLNEAEKKINIEDALDSIKRECKDAWGSFQKGNYLYRGSSGSDTGAKYYSGRSGRTSANTLNYYTLLMDNDPRWGKFPKRSESFICSTDIEYAESFGDVMYMFPKDGAVFGVCPSMDLWDSFNKTIGREYQGMLSDVMYIIQKISKSLDIIDTEPKTYGGLVEMFKDMDKAWIRHGGGVDHSKPLIKRYDGDFMGLFKSIIDPKKNGFKISKSINNLPRDREIWFSGPVYQISILAEDKLKENIS